MSDVVLYQAKDGHIQLDVNITDETVWLTLNQLSELFGRDKSVISRHIKNIFKINELDKFSVVANFATTASDGKTYQVEHFNLDMVISVGYRVNSKEAVSFRQWASKILKEHLVRGYTTNEHRLATRGLTEIQQTVTLLQKTLTNHHLVNEIARL
jgi:hypothetical protein